MKRVILLLFALVLLTGCSGNESPETTAHLHTNPTELTVQPTEPPVHTRDEEASGEALLVCDLSVLGNATHIYPGANQVAVLTDSGTVHLLKGETGLLSGSVQADSVIGVSETGVLHYKGTAVRYTAFDGTDIGSWTLSQEPQAAPLADFSEGKVYFSVHCEIRLLDLRTGVERVLKEHSYADAQLVGFCGSYLKLQGADTCVYVSTADGLTVYDNSDGVLLDADGERRLLSRMDGIVQKVLLEEKGQVLCRIGLTPEEILPALALGGLMRVCDDGAYFYTLPDGRMTGQLPLSAAPDQTEFYGSFAWFLCENKAFRWDVTAAGQTGDVITIPDRTAQDPDTEALAALKARVQEMNNTYGVRIRIWDDAVSAPAGYTFTPEYHAEVISAQLDQLEEAFAIFPGGFLRTTVKNDWVYINLVRSISGDEPFMQYWQDGGCYVTISVYADVAEAFYTGLGWGVDSHILGNSRDLEYWNDLNPQGFDYDYSFPQNYLRDDTQYLEEGERFFADKRSMAFPTEDRARIFYHAITDPDGSLFENLVLQQKLKLVCEGIRESYGLKNSTQVFAWEQYLDTPLAKVS